MNPELKEAYDNLVRSCEELVRGDWQNVPYSVGTVIRQIQYNLQEIKRHENKGLSNQS